MKLRTLLFFLVIAAASFSCKKGEEPLNAKILSISASSTLSSAKNTYKVQNLIDKDLNTFWSEGSDGFGEGHSITIKFDKEVELSGFYIQNGVNDKLLYKLNGRVKYMRITSPDDRNKKITVKIEDTGVDNFQWVKFDKPIKGKTFEFRIMQVYEGAKWKDTCITEIGFRGAKPSEFVTTRERKRKGNLNLINYAENFGKDSSWGALSPDGKTIFVDGRKDTVLQGQHYSTVTKREVALYFMDVNTLESIKFYEKQVDGDSLSIYKPKFSGNGKRFAFIEDMPKDTIYVVNSDGTGLKSLGMFNNVMDYRFTLDGKYLIAHVEQKGEKVLLGINIDTGKKTKILSSDRVTFYDFTSDKRLCVGSGNTFYILNKNGTVHKKYEKGVNTEAFRIDERRGMVYVCNSVSEWKDKTVTSIYSYNLSGNDSISSLYKPETGNIFRYTYIGLAEFPFPLVSKSKSYVFFPESIDKRDVPIPYKLVRFDLNKKTSLTLHLCKSYLALVALSPNNKKIIFYEMIQKVRTIFNPGGAFHGHAAPFFVASMYVINTDGTSKIKLTHAIERLVFLGFSRDSRKIYYSDGSKLYERRIG